MPLIPHEDQERLQENIFRAIGFEVLPNKKVKGASDLTHFVGGMAFNQETKHVVLLNTPCWIMGESVRKDLLLQILDIGSAVKNTGHSFSAVTYLPWIEVNPEDLGLQEASAKVLEDRMGEILRFTEYQRKLGGLADVPVYLLGNDDVVMKSTNSWHRTGMSPEDFRKETQSIQKFTSTFGGFSWRLNQLNPDEAALIAKGSSEDQDRIKGITTRLGIYAFFRPPIDELCIGLVGAGNLQGGEEAKGFLEKAERMGHRLAPPVIVDSTTQLNPKTVLEKLMQSEQVTKDVTFRLTEDGKQYFECNIKATPRESLVDKILRVAETALKQFEIKLNLADLFRRTG